MTGADSAWTDPDQMPCEAGPAEAFSSRLAPVGERPLVNDIDAGSGPDSISVAEVFDSVCCGWPEPPTSQEFHKAVRAAEPDARQKLIIWTWIDEAPVLSWVSAWRERAYSWRMLARAARNCGNDTYPRLRILNTFAERPELIPDDAVPWLERRPDVPGWEETLKPWADGSETEEPRVKLPEPAKGLWKETADGVEEYLAEHLNGYDGWEIGGGTVLAARWGHRGSTDIDEKVKPGSGLEALKSKTTRKAETPFKEAMRRFGAIRFGGRRPNRLTVVFPQGRIDITEGTSPIEYAWKEEQVDHRTAKVSFTSRILAGKMARWDRSPTRDVFDMAVAAQTDPRSLETALNRIPAAERERASTGWTARRNFHRENARRVLMNVADEWQETADDPVGAAVAACWTRAYRRVEVETTTDRIRVEIVCNDGIRRELSQKTGEALELEKWLKTSGVEDYARIVGSRNHLAEIARARRQAEETPRQRSRNRGRRAP